MKTKARIAKIAGWSSSLLLLLSARIAFAQSTPITLCDPLSGNGCNYGGETFTSVLGNIMGNLLLPIGGPICGILVIVGGFQMMTAAGDPEKFSKGKKTLLYAAIGFAVLLFATSVPPLIKNILTGQ